jgi:hypothetical protein
MTELAIETRDLVKRYGSIAAVDGESHLAVAFSTLNCD